MILRQHNPIQSAASALSGETFADTPHPAYEERLLYGWGPRMIRNGTKRWKSIPAATPPMTSTEFAAWKTAWEASHPLWTDYVQQQLTQAKREGYVQNPFGRRCYSRTEADICEFLLYSTAMDDLKVAITRAAVNITGISFGFVKPATASDLAALRATKTLIPWEDEL